MDSHGSHDGKRIHTHINILAIRGTQMSVGKISLPCKSQYPGCDANSWITGNTHRDITRETSTHTQSQLLYSQEALEERSHQQMHVIKASVHVNVQGQGYSG
ncbi:hypothetical protein ILYODFUR_023694 [Ilyodon furcidens]|uniref:Uncharacterized protein n=1 Tax=Ilyodon furcidens TaxID=33524 RepID=A0ABV0UJY5_9TELE